MGRHILWWNFACLWTMGSDLLGIMQHGSSCILHGNMRYTNTLTAQTVELLIKLYFIGLKVCLLINARTFLIMNFQQMSQFASAEEKFALAKSLLKNHPKKFTQCWECGMLCDEYIKCESYKENRELLCVDCAQYCRHCDAYFCSGGDYRHEECDEKALEEEKERKSKQSRKSTQSRNET